MDMTQDRGWCFIGMEYYALVLNRTFVIAINGDLLEGTLCRGLTSTAGGRDGLSRYINGKLAVHGDLDDPSAYMGERAYPRRKRADFSLPLRELESVEHDPREKWGMGYYPHDDRLYLRTATRTREFILVGRQSGQAICARIRAAAGLARAIAASTGQTR